MNLILNLNDISYKNIFFNDSIKNTIINNSNFIKIIYSNNIFILNGLYIKISLYYKSQNLEIMNYIHNLEKYILTTYNNVKIHNYKLREQLKFLISKLNNSNKNIFNYILKISGIWETDSIIGVTYKFLII